MQNLNNENSISVGVSSCLLGEKVRFDSGHKRNRFIADDLGKHFKFVPFCPEVASGLSIPRPTIRLTNDSGETRAVMTKDATIDVTDKLAQSAKNRHDIHQQLSGYIVKKDSPSCGMERVKLYSKDHPQREGVGIFTQVLLDNFPHLPVEEEGRLNDAVLRECFVQRVFIYHRWQQLVASNPTWAEVGQFHAKHKYIYMSRSPAKAKALGHWLGQNHKLAIDQLCHGYIEQLTELLKNRATVKKHVNTLSHIQGYLKKFLDKTDKLELVRLIELYRSGLVPLVVPMTMLKHHFTHHPDKYIAESYYFDGYPQDLKLANSL